MRLTANALAAVVTLTVVSGCGKMRTCKPGTLLLSVTLDAASAAADTFDITATVDGRTTHATVAHNGGASGTLELDFAPGTAYPVGKSLSLTLEGKRQGQLVGEGTITALVLPANCAVAKLNVNSVGPSAGNDLRHQEVADLAGSDIPQAAMDLAGVDQSGSRDMAQSCGLASSHRCNPTDHSKQQVCGNNGAWQDQACQATTNPPTYACTDATGRCTDTGWAQWKYTSIPNPRFSTVPDSTGNGQDIIKDAWTGLSWELKIPDTLYSWGSDAQTYCSSLSYGGFHDWRLPSPVELATLLDLTVVYNPANGPPLIQQPFAAYTQPAAFWTSTPVASATPGTAAWVVSFQLGLINTAGNTLSLRVRCVR
jgi:hypothetical protein